MRKADKVPFSTRQSDIKEQRLVEILGHCVREQTGYSTERNLNGQSTLSKSTRRPWAHQQMGQIVVHFLELSQNQIQRYSTAYWGISA